MKKLSLIVLIITLLAVGAGWKWLHSGPELSATDAVSRMASSQEALFDHARLEKGRIHLSLEDPRLINRFIGGETFGGPSSQKTALHMFSRDPSITAEIRKKTKRIELAPGAWLVRFPIVNAAFFETPAGVVIVDTGMAAAGPVLIEHIREVTDAPIAAIIITHGHVDHLWGAWAFEAASEGPMRIIAHENVKPRIDRYLRLKGSISKYLSQPEDELPKLIAGLTMPTEYFSDRLELDFGGDTFILQHRRGETDDHLYVWAPARKVIAVGDFYQGFLPNLGNGKRVQRFGSEWIAALREMAELGADYMMPMHGKPVSGSAQIADDFNFLADALAHIETQVVTKLNAGYRQDEVIALIEWPDKYADDPRLANYYVTHQDIGKMFMRGWTGWWNDQPAHWSPATVEAQSRLIVDLAGGMDAFLQRAGETAETDIVLAAHMADWAFFAQPNHKGAQDFSIRVYKQRIIDRDIPTQEALAYFDHISLIRGLQLEGKDLTLHQP